VTLVPLPRLAAGTTQVYRVRLKAVGAGRVRVRVMLNSDQMVGPAEETESTRPYEE